MENHNRMSCICADTNSKTGKTILDLAEEGLSYLDTRTDFWRQQKPMYARHYERHCMRKKYSSKKTVSDDYIIGELEKIDEGTVLYVYIYISDSLVGWLVGCWAGEREYGRCVTTHSSMHWPLISC